MYSVEIYRYDLQEMHEMYRGGVKQKETIITLENYPTKQDAVIAAKKRMLIIQDLIAEDHPSLKYNSGYSYIIHQQ